MFSPMSAILRQVRQRPDAPSKPGYCHALEKGSQSGGTASPHEVHVMSFGLFRSMALRLSRILSSRFPTGVDGVVAREVESLAARPNSAVSIACRFSMSLWLASRTSFGSMSLFLRVPDAVGKPPPEPGAVVDFACELPVQEPCLPCLDLGFDIECGKIHQEIPDKGEVLFEAERIALYGLEQMEVWALGDRVS